jgi:hypothetical protein
VSLDLVERRQQGPGLECVAVIAIGREPQDSAAAALRRFEAEDRLDGIGADAPHVAWRSPMLVYPETGRTDASGLRCQLRQNGIRTIDGLDVPRQGQHIAPMAVGMKQRREARCARRCEHRFELRQPSLRNHRDVVCSGQHWRSPGWLGRNHALRLAYPPEATLARNTVARATHSPPNLNRS